MKATRAGLALLVLSLLLASWLSGCGGPPAPAAGPEVTSSLMEDVRAQAAAEATAIIQQAQATALVLQAQAQATTMVQQALAQGSEVAATPSTTSPAAMSPAVVAAPLPAPAETVAATGEVTAADVELLGVSFGADGAFIYVQFRAHPKVAETFWPGALSVTDEATGTVYNEVPVMPVIGPLIARPKQEGQLGYVMLVNAPNPLARDAVVTVVLGDYTFQHVAVQ